METNKLVKAFESELSLTEQGFIELKERKKGLVIDVTTEEGFKQARKERTEMNKVLKNIDSLAIDGKKSVNEARNNLKGRVRDIYAINVDAFEKEDTRRKEEAARLKKIEEDRIQGIRNQINSIRDFGLNLFGKSSQELQDIIESVDLIDVNVNFEELTQEATQVKSETLSQLNMALSSAIQNEQLAEERRKLDEERKAFELQKAQQQPEVEEVVDIEVPELCSHAKFSELMYALTKHAARNSFVDFLEEWGLTEEDYAEIKEYLNSNLGPVKTYL